MNDKSWESLYEKYSSLFEHRKDRSIPLKYGIECDIGWYDILSSLCFLIAQHENNIKTRNIYLVKFTQIKEKLGGLRIYIDNKQDSYIDGLIAMAESWSYKTCEKCGEKGSLRNKNNWLKTLCDKCNNEIRSQHSETNNK